MTRPIENRRCQPSILWVSLTIALALLMAACAGSATPAAYEGTALERPAIDFRLVDQRGVEVTLSDLRGRVVVLTFMDSQCQEVCPLTAAHLRAANQQLEGDAASVIFVGVNVNVEANRVEDVQAVTSKWRLDEIPTWHFLTGSAEELESVWQAYGIAVVPGSDELQHTPGIFLIDRAGQQRWYISTPFDEAGTPQWTVPLSELLVRRIRELLSEGS